MKIVIIIFNIIINIIHSSSAAFTELTIMQSMMLDASFLLLVSCILHFYYLSKGQEVTYCDNSMNYTSGSAYQQNLNLTLTSLAANASLTGYYISTVGLVQNPNLVYGLKNCPGFTPKEVCHDCANSVATKIIQRCPNQKVAFVFNESCLLQYSDLPFFSTADIAIKLVFLSSRCLTRHHGDLKKN